MTDKEAASLIANYAESLAVESPKRTAYGLLLDASERASAETVHNVADHLGNRYLAVTASEYKTLTGIDPEQDDLERLNCDQAGQIGHSMCGLCERHNKPRYLCGCMLYTNGIVVTRDIKPGIKLVRPDYSSSFPYGTIVEH